MLADLTKRYGLAVFFDLDGKVYACRPEKVVGDSVKYELRGNVINDDKLQHLNRKDVKNTNQGDLLQKRTARASRRKKGTEGGSARTLYFYDVQDMQELATLAQNELERETADGYDGSITTFLEPYAAPGMVAELTDPCICGTVGEVLHIHRYRRFRFRRRTADGRNRNGNMSGEADIIELRRRLSGIGRAPGGETFPATVRGVDGDRRTCTVEAEDVTYDDVLLYAVADAGRRGFCFLPAVGSIVLVSRLGGSNELYVAMFSEVDEVRLSVGRELFLHDGGRFRRGPRRQRPALHPGTAHRRDMRAHGDDRDGASGPPINAADFMQIKEDLKNYLTA